MHGISLLVRHRKMEKRKKGIDHGASYSVPAAVLYRTVVSKVGVKMHSMIAFGLSFATVVSSPIFEDANHLMLTRTKCHRQCQIHTHWTMLKMIKRRSR